MRFLHKAVTGFIETNVTVPSQTQQLQICTAQFLNQFVVPGTLCLGICGQTVRHMGIFHIDVNVIEQVGIHEIPITLIVGRCQTFILVQVHGTHFFETQVPLRVPRSQLLVGSHRCRPGGQTQHTGRVTNHLCGDQMSCTAAHGRIIGFLIDPRHL